MVRTSALTPTQQTKAAALYASGLSAQRIAEHFNISLHASTYALRKAGVTFRTPSHTRRIQFEAKPLSFSILKSLSREQELLKQAAVMLYWAEGHKAGGGRVDFANSDPRMVLLFRKFLTEICGVHEPKIRCFLYCHEGQDSDSLIAFWSTLLSIPPTQFTKPYVKPGKPGVRGPRMQYGLVHLRYCDTKLLQQLLLWIEELAGSCVGTQVVNEGTL